MREMWQHSADKDKGRWETDRKREIKYKVRMRTPSVSADILRGAVGWNSSAAYQQLCLSPVDSAHSFPNAQLEMNHQRDLVKSGTFVIYFLKGFPLFFFFFFPTHLISPTRFSSVSPSSSPVSSPSIAAPFFPPYVSSVFFFFFSHYYFTLSTVSAGPLWSREDWTTDWTIYFCKDTSVSNHSISCCLYRTRTHALLFVIETLLLVNRLCCIWEKNYVCVCVLAYVCSRIHCSPQNALPSSYVRLALGKKEKKEMWDVRYFLPLNKLFLQLLVTTAREEHCLENKPTPIRTELSKVVSWLFFTAVIMCHMLHNSFGGGTLGWKRKHLESPSVLI